MPPGRNKASSLVQPHNFFTSEFPTQVSILLNCGCFLSLSGSQPTVPRVITPPSVKCLEEFDTMRLFLPQLMVTLIGIFVPRIDDYASTFIHTFYIVSVDRFDL